MAKEQPLIGKPNTLRNLTSPQLLLARHRKYYPAITAAR
jgi:hypothetical protein